QHRIQIEENPDLVIYHPKCNYAVIWGMANPGKTIMVSPIPFMAHPIDHIITMGGNCGKTLNRLSFWFVNTLKATVLKFASRKFLKDYNGLKLSVSSIKKVMLEKEKTLYTISPSLFPKPDYWPEAA